MRWLHDWFVGWRHQFEQGGKWERYYPLYDVFYNLFFASSARTTGPTQVRDAADVQRIMATVWLATFPCMLWGMYNLGHLSLLASQGLQEDNIRHAVAGLISSGHYYSVWDCLVLGATWFVPIYVVTFVVGIAWEVLFAVVRRHEINEGFFVTSVLFALACPPTVPLWQVALGISFGVVIAKEVFGGTGKNFVNPALAGRAFLYFAYPAQWSGDTVWAATDGASWATPLAVAAAGGLPALTAEGQYFSFFDAALGGIPGSIGETSVLAILLGAVVLLYAKVASWRIMLGGLLGMAGMAGLFNLVGSETNPMFSVPPHWHLVMGGFAFGLVFMATEPVTASVTNAGRWVYGVLIGVMAVLIRVVNPAFPEGMMLAILFCNLCAPAIDELVIRAKLRLRARKLGLAPAGGAAAAAPAGGGGGAAAPAAPAAEPAAAPKSEPAPESASGASTSAAPKAPEPKAEAPKAEAPKAETPAPKAAEPAKTEAPKAKTPAPKAAETKASGGGAGSSSGGAAKSGGGAAGGGAGGSGAAKSGGGSGGSAGGGGKSGQSSGGGSGGSGGSK